MSIFASHTQDTVAIPFDPPHTVTIRRLTAREIENAQKSHAANMADGESRLWSARFRRILEGSVSDRKEIEQAIADPLTGYDRFVLVRSGLLAWSYTASVKPVSAKPATAARGNTPATPAVDASDAVADLDDEAVDFIATEILRLTKPGLFQTPDEAETARKNESGPSTSV